jgi:glycosyltransferase involved in cell wall biosynthesis
MKTFQGDAKPQVRRRSRIIFIPEIEAFGGAERSCLALSRWLYEHQEPHTFLLYKDRLNLASMASHPLTILELEPRMRALDKVGSLRRSLAELNIEPSQLLASGIQAVLHAGLAGMRGFHTLMHDTPSLLGQESRKKISMAAARGRLSNWLIGRSLRSGGRLMVNSEYLRLECRDLYSIEADIVRMGGMMGKHDFRLRPVKGQLRMLSVSRVESNKRIDWILRALARMESGESRLSARVQWQFDIVGEGSCIELLKRLSRDLGLSERVHFHGFLSDEEVVRKYELAHLFLIPARQGYGLPALEALYRGIPVLLHRESGVSDILLDTPWVTVITDGEESMLDGLMSAVASVIGGNHIHVPLPRLPTEDDWAKEVARLCGWIQSRSI